MALQLVESKANTEYAPFAPLAHCASPLVDTVTPDEGALFWQTPHVAGCGAVVSGAALQCPVAVN
jgi:hypothetical protein